MGRRKKSWTPPERQEKPAEPEARPTIIRLADPEHARLMHELRSSNATQRHVPLGRKKTRRERIAQAIREDHEDR